MASAWTGESAWSGGAYVRLGPGGRVAGTVDLPVGGGWWLFPVLDRQQVPAGTVATSHRLDGALAGRADHGGAGAQGVTAVPGFLDLGVTGPVEAGAGPAELVSAYAGTGPEARLDAVMAQPEVEWLVLGGSGGGQAVARSFARHREVRVPTCPATARPPPAATTVPAGWSRWPPAPVRERRPLPWGRRYYGKGLLLEALAPGAVDRIGDLLAAAPGPDCGVGLLSLGGAFGRVPEDATAFSGRDAALWLITEAVWDNPSEDPARVAWGRDAMAALRPFATSVNQNIRP